MTNQSAYRNRQVAEAYATASDLYAPEKAIIDLLRSELGKLCVLDLGIGGGRTTKHLAPLVKEYIGVDYSPEMIEACRRRFPKLAQAGAFKVCDARAMQIFPDNYFDLVLFSFNGIDYVSHQDRERILDEVSRVCRSDGLFVFSSHNLDSDVSAKFSISGRGGLAAKVKQAAGGVLFRLLNPHWYQRKTQEFLIINDGAHHFRLRTYYVHPGAQVRQLMAMGFDDVKVLTLDGKVIIPGEQERTPDPWLYYFATVRKNLRGSLHPRLENRGQKPAEL